jgi:hypothetical protein
MFIARRSILLEDPSMRSEIWLRAELKFCVIRDRAVFLDLRNDRYFALSIEKTQKLARSFSSVAQVDDLEGLFQEGLLALVGNREMEVEPAIPIHPNKLCDVAGPVSIEALATALLYLFGVKIVQLLAPSRIFRRGVRDTGLRNHLSKYTRAQLVHAMMRATDLLPFTVNCVVRSFALKHLLAQHGFPTQLVIGVQLEPFIAHCWVQADGELLNDKLDCIRSFTPIAAN